MDTPYVRLKDFHDYLIAPRSFHSFLFPGCPERWSLQIFA